MRLTSVFLSVAVVAGFVWLIVESSTAREAREEPVPALVSASGAGWSQARDAWVQTGGDMAAEKDERVPVQVWTVFAAGGALAVGLLLFLVRVVMGGVKAPPAQGEEHH